MSSRGKGKQQVVDEPVTKKRKGSGSTSTSPVIPFEERFVDDTARKRFIEEYANGVMWFERPLVLENVCPDFVKSLKNRKWKALIGVPKTPVNETVVREWYANLNDADLQAGFVRCRDMKVPISSHAINNHYKLGVFRGSDHMDGIRDLVDDERDALEEMRVKLNEQQLYEKTQAGNIKGLFSTSWSPDDRVILRWIQHRILPKNNISHASMQELYLMYALEHDIPVNVGWEIMQHIRSHINKHRVIVCPYLIHGLCIDAKVPEYDTDITAQVPKGIAREPPTPAYLKAVAAREEAELDGVPVTDAAAERGTSSAPPPPLTLEALQRQILQIADTQRGWFRAAHRTSDRILANQGHLNAGIRDNDQSHYVQASCDYTYDPSLEEAIARLNLGNAEE